MVKASTEFEFAYFVNVSHNIGRHLTNLNIFITIIVIKTYFHVYTLYTGTGLPHLLSNNCTCGLWGPFLVISIAYFKYFF